MARVYDGFDQRLERPVAVKILRPQTRALPNMCKRFQQEARIAARLVHPNIVAVLDYGEDDSSSYLIMERLPGTTLRDEIIRGPLPRQRVMSVMVETLAALAAAHKLGVVHRDIKPSNILLQDDGHAKITDFGIAKSFDVGGAPDRVADDLTMTGVVLGTPGYLAPERRSGQPATVQSDLFAVGAVMVEVLTGRRLVPGPEATEQLPLPFRDVARRALAVDPQRSVHLGDRHAACHENPAGRRGTRPAAAPNHADVIGGGHPPGRCPQGCWRDRGLVIASSGASQKRAHAAATPDPRGRRRGGGSRRLSVPVLGRRRPTRWTGRPGLLASPCGLAPHRCGTTSGLRRPRRGDHNSRGVVRERRVPRRRGDGRRSLCRRCPTARGRPSGSGATGSGAGPGAPRGRRHYIGAVPGRREHP